jgi:autotransporter passenger strand-loop-strand repeat protein
VASDTLVLPGGRQFVSSGGSALSATLAGGIQFVNSFGHAEHTNVGSGGILFVTSFASASGAVLSSGGIEFVQSNGSGVDTQIDSGGILILVPGADDSGVSNAGGTIVNTGVILTSWGYNVDIEGTAASSLVVTGPNDLEYVLAGGTATDSFVTSSGEQDVYLGGLAIGNEVVNLAAQYVVGGEVVSTLLSAGGRSFLQSGGIASDTTIQANAFMVVSDGATATDTNVQSGGSLYATSGGSLISSFVAVGGYLVVSSGRPMSPRAASPAIPMSTRAARSSYPPALWQSERLFSPTVFRRYSMVVSPAIRCCI